jgi:hypothetical protein
MITVLSSTKLLILSGVDMGYMEGFTLGVDVFPSLIGFIQFSLLIGWFSVVLMHTL